MRETGETESYRDVRKCRAVLVSYRVSGSGVEVGVTLPRVTTNHPSTTISTDKVRNPPSPLLDASPTPRSHGDSSLTLKDATGELASRYQGTG